MASQQPRDGLSKDEKKDAVERSAPSAAVVFEAIRAQAEDELARTGRALFWSGLAAGLSMGFSFITQALLYAGVPDSDWRPLITKLGYTVGFLIVILGRQQLFTENTLTPVLQVLHAQTLDVALRTLRLWGIVLAANLLGTLIFAAALHFGRPFDADAVAALGIVAEHALEGDFGSVLFRAIFAGWLIALMVWLLPFAETARVMVIVILTYLIGIGGFPHVIAGSSEAFYAAMNGIASWSEALFYYLLPTLLGNLIGGVALVAALNYAQVSPENGSGKQAQSSQSPPSRRSGKK